MTTSQLPKYTWEEIRKHNHDKDCWVVLYRRVLDVTKFLNEHPGGLDTINDLGGYDITNSFESIGHSSSALALSKEFIIGELDPSSAPPPVRVRKLGDDVPLTKVKGGGGVLSVYHIVGLFLLILLLLCYIFAT
ncbi:cytochrome b5, putative [Trypanosoma equiperdum]|uniref:Cytochrome b5, putative n=4 Tax=Trypanozoon TaxID=39700 RepID=Q385A5_TRYB2|nr:cytochrome b5, putative [Trypanosoma brucei gambiense DAL972]XP_828738.1 cytochrome b5, putative [Trypanosoma brucei brucei TREU927]RHW67233.1 cytochrome b5 [Trypanosoma brucei equiperdum]SCU70765.1 cytochrome b5, putative [Trypanosoma equiperdum]EAN79626.1 cytochrome b5, putative [Trypanosoma brucei brucei TREU927]CBH17633.1 cytochrome b5, putative [Trypanosoma brucei gambiense DAL972]|eukprot:XP_011779897.1 cytochrome b5, putative [Trypanosoma brucei gambiense DAL972]